MIKYQITPALPGDTYLLTEGYRRLDEYMFEPGDDVEKIIERFPHVLLIGPFTPQEMIKFAHFTPQYTFQFKCGRVPIRTPPAMFVKDLVPLKSVPLPPPPPFDPAALPCLFLTREMDEDITLPELVKRAIRHVQNPGSGDHSIVTTALAAMACPELGELHSNVIKGVEGVGGTPPLPPLLEYYGVESVEEGLRTVEHCHKKYKETTNVPLATKLAVSMVRYETFREPVVVAMRDIERHRNILREGGWIE